MPKQTRSFTQLGPAAIPIHDDRDMGRALALQESLQIKLLNADSKIQCKQDQWKRSEGGGGKTLAFSKGEFIEKGGINFSDVSGGKLPKTATQNRPELEGASFRGMGVSVVFHPDNPFIPTTHANVRYFEARKENEPLNFSMFGGCGCFFFVFPHAFPFKPLKKVSPFRFFAHFLLLIPFSTGLRGFNNIATA